MQINGASHNSNDSAQNMTRQEPFHRFDGNVPTWTVPSKKGKRWKFHKNGENEDRTGQAGLHEDHTWRLNSNPIEWVSYI